jgi:hypothetical protein
VSSEAGYLRSARAVRERAQAMFALAERGTLTAFSLDLDRLPGVVDRVLKVTRASYPDVRAIPPHARWRHFDAGGVGRLSAFESRLVDLPRDEALRARLDLVITSVLLDAGAGPRWSFREPGTGRVFTRSEGLAVASYHAFLAGAFSSAPREQPLRADAAGLAAVSEEALGRLFQVEPGSAAPPLVGLAGRAALLRRLGEVVERGPRLFPGPVPRVGNLGAFLLGQAAGGSLPAKLVFAAVLDALGPIWPGRHEAQGINLGDTWPHPQLGLVPFHKLSQWLTYSLIEPLAAAGVRVIELDDLTGLAEYRNGGLFLDGGVLVPRSPAILEPGNVHPVGSPVVVEWRALTVALLDRTATELRRRLDLDAASLPLAKVLEGGTWQAGRALAREKRSDGRPPLEVESDGTVF